MVDVSPYLALLRVCKPALTHTCWIHAASAARNSGGVKTFLVVQLVTAAVSRLHSASGPLYCSQRWQGAVSDLH